MTRAIIQPLSTFALILLCLLALAACMPGDNGGGVPYYPDKPAQKPIANIIGFPDSCPARSTDVLSMNTHDFSGRVCVAQVHIEQSGGALEPFVDDSSKPGPK